MLSQLSQAMVHAPALKEADIGCCESSDDNFASADTILSWGPRVYCNIQELIQFQLVVNTVAVIIDIVAVFPSGNLRFSAFEFDRITEFHTKNRDREMKKCTVLFIHDSLH